MYGEKANEISKKIFMEKAEDFLEEIDVDITKDNLKIFIKYKSLGYKDCQIEKEMFKIDYKCLY